jgi:PhnB protein
MLVQSYLFFEGRCEEALEFYKKAIGAEVKMIMRMKESPEPPPPGMCPPGSDDTIMHAEFSVGETLLMASDGRVSGKPSFKGVSLAITTKTEAEANRLFNALGEGGTVEMPMAKTFFSPAFGGVSDRFGVSWMVLADMPA